MAASRPRIALVNDYEVVVAGLSAMLEPFADRVEVIHAELIDEPLDHVVAVALYDTFGRQGLEEAALDKLLSRPEIERVAVYSFNMDGPAVQMALDAGASGYLSKATPAAELVEQLIGIAEGEQVVATATTAGRSARRDRGWPGGDLGLSERESEVVALAAMGRRNADIAEALFVSVDTVKTHLARSFRKLGVHNRTELSAMVHRHDTFRRFLPDAS